MSASSPEVSASRFRETKLAIAVLDLAGFFALCRDHEDLEIAAFLEDFYRLCHDRIAAAGGRVVKFVGDAVLSVFPPERTAAAVEAAVALRREVARLGEARGWRVAAGVNLHLARVVEGEFGPEGDRRYDVIGSGVNHAFVMGRGAGMRISEPVYRQLPSGERSPWAKQKPPATYVLSRE